MKKGGFTLLELLVVIVVISILATLVVGGANYALRVARAKRRAVSCKTLQTAIHRYYTEYNAWPGPPPNGQPSVTYEKDNDKVFGALRASNTGDPPNGNKDEIVFIDETAFFTPDGDEATKLSETTGSKPLVFVSKAGRWTWKKDGEFRYYRVTINYEFQTVTVDTKKRLWDKWKNNGHGGYDDVDIFEVEDEDEFWKRYEER